MGEFFFFAGYGTLCVAFGFWLASLLRTADDTLDAVFDVKTNQAYRRALIFYANPANWMSSVEDGTYRFSAVVRDSGDKARAALDGKIAKETEE